MNLKRLLIAIVAAFLTVWVTDFLIHGVILRPSYQATAELWRPEPEMQGKMGWMMLGQLMVAVAMTILYVKGFAQHGSLRCAMVFGFFMGLFGNAYVPIYYAVQPMPGDLCLKWLVTGMVQAVLLGAVLFFVYKPTTQSSS